MQQKGISWTCVCVSEPGVWTANSQRLKKERQCVGKRGILSIFFCFCPYDPSLSLLTHRENVLPSFYRTVLSLSRSSIASCLCLQSRLFTSRLSIPFFLVLFFSLSLLHSVRGCAAMRCLRTWWTWCKRMWYDVFIGCEQSSKSWFQDERHMTSNRSWTSHSLSDSFLPSIPFCMFYWRRIHSMSCSGTLFASRAHPPAGLRALIVIACSHISPSFLSNS